MSGRIKEITAEQAASEMRMGWNLGNTLDAVDGKLSIDDSPIKYETAWHNVETTPEIMKTVVDAGFNVIRIPVSWGKHIDFENGNKVRKAWMDRVKEVVDYAYNSGAYVILNTHHDANWLNTFEKDFERGSAVFADLWNQIADTFKEYDEHLIFEGMNELRYPGTPLEWVGDEPAFEIVNKYNELFVRTIRERADENKDRILVISTYCGAQREPVLKNYAVPLNNGEKDEKLMVAVHCYDPEPFALSSQGTGVWTEADKGPVDAVFERIDTLLAPFGIPVILDEFAALKKADPDNDASRIRWVKYFLRRAKASGVKCCWWDNGHAFPGHGMGLLDRREKTWFHPDLVKAIMEEA
ncbi:MAG: glycoside hydrolase family 5 protein [Lachnospiraceae bacterium]|nr:glycoside hydrolase family 5 protein [Lachnospiraceae bacterium]